jgi:hypothetical protein
MDIASEMRHASTAEDVVFSRKTVANENSERHETGCPENRDDHDRSDLVATPAYAFQAQAQAPRP